MSAVLSFYIDLYLKLSHVLWKKDYGMGNTRGLQPCPTVPLDCCTASSCDFLDTQWPFGSWGDGVWGRLRWGRQRQRRETNRTSYVPPPLYSFVSSHLLPRQPLPVGCSLVSLYFFSDNASSIVFVNIVAIFLSSYISFSAFLFYSIFSSIFWGLLF